MEDKVLNTINNYYKSIVNIGFVLNKDIYYVLVYLFLSDYVRKFNGKLTDKKIREIMDIFECLDKFSCYTTEIDLNTIEEFNKMFYDKYDGGILESNNNINSKSFYGKTI